MGSIAMSTRTTLRAFRSLQSAICSSCRHAQARAFSHTTPIFAANSDSDIIDTPISSTTTSKPSSPDSSRSSRTLDSLLGTVDANYRPSATFSNLIPGQPLRNLTAKEWEADDAHKLHIYATKHNTHITLTKPNRDALISVSCGNIGFRKAGRGSFDAAYQLAGFVMTRIVDKGLLPAIEKLEVVYRGFGPGREAVTKAILGAEGRRIRGLIVRLSDSTRLKFGGTRSPKPRRLG